jgi:hypothetical protein
MSAHNFYNVAWNNRLLKVCDVHHDLINGNTPKDWAILVMNVDARALIRQVL